MIVVDVPGGVPDRADATKVLEERTQEEQSER